MDTIMVEAINNTGVRLSVVDVRGDYPKIINLVHQLYSIVYDRVSPSYQSSPITHMRQLETDYSLFHHICNILTWVYRTQFSTAWSASAYEYHAKRFVEACVALEVLPVELERKCSL